MLRRLVNFLESVTAKDMRDMIRNLAEFKEPLQGEEPEAMNSLLERISIDPSVCFGKPCIRGTRIWVSLILDFLASGTSMEELLEEYPQLTLEDVLAAIAYGAEMARDQKLPCHCEPQAKQSPRSYLGIASAENRRLAMTG